MEGKGEGTHRARNLAFVHDDDPVGLHENDQRLSKVEMNAYRWAINFLEFMK